MEVPRCLLLTQSGHRRSLNGPRSNSYDARPEAPGGTAMRRREFIAVLSGAATWPLAAHAQQPDRVPRTTIWMGRPNDSEGQRLAAAFRDGLQALGWNSGRNIQTDYRWVTSDMDRLSLAKDIIEQDPKVIVAETTPAVAALARVSTRIPIVFVNVSDPVGAGFVQSLAHPGGSILCRSRCSR